MADKTAILSVGIDVGTSTTQVVFSKLQMDNAGGYFSVPRVAIVDKEVVYKSEVYMTPLKTDVLIDTDALRDIVAAEFRKAGYRPEDTDSGAVIITGESARKENSDAVLKSLSDFAGDFVVSAAGPDMESLIAGKGSGAWQYSMDHHCRVANLDIGGGTTNVVLFEDGETLARGCLDIGGRLICMNPQGIITKVSPAAAVMAQAAGVSVSVGDRCDELKLTAVTRQMAAALNAYLGVGTKDIDAILRQIKTPGSSDFPVPEKVQAVFFSGGVADLIYHESADTWAYGDIGVLLGRAIRESRLFTDFQKMEPGETIRATVVGAGTYTTTISGSTITYSDDIFPLKNIPVIKLDEELQEACFAGETEPVIRRIQWVLGQNDEEHFILAMPGKRNPGYTEMKRAAASIRQIMDRVQPPGEPILLVIESDIAKAMGQMIRQQPDLKRQVVAIDSIHVEDGEYVDMGKPMMNGMVIPVVVKTLIFG
ncbi:Ethanolamine utilization protein, possible chaperonin protecting lyase from inhibition [Coprococcus catus GD/7]|jgi:ethanolamine utilization protein EutA|uniref:Ethanolamine utilization protein, possible chaperonin protecting lyase from inhibition n=1 Tax=Coprococcus catus GD/7 TaxID=717962 RepID=D4J566_9FIRM|nr:ethanolamine utilization protein EutA [Coprococcus catus]CBK79487.1 Ethanolamine utilization protein, possible chaperonin protecting lyase from inhibition [Coprococcus catus GD/7]